jgi:hypothetical protein
MGIKIINTYLTVDVGTKRTFWRMMDFPELIARLTVPTPIA